MAVPFADGIPVLLAQRGRRMAMLASGDPFWYGAGTSVTRHLAAHEWHAARAINLRPGRALGWAWNTSPASACTPRRWRACARICARTRLLVLLRDGAAVAELARYLVDADFGASGIACSKHWADRTSAGATRSPPPST